MWMYTHTHGYFKNKGITLIALIITIIILLLLAGISIAILSGKNGIFANVKQAKKAQLKAEMKEQLTMALQELQIEKKSNATLEDVTQEWIQTAILSDYKPEIKEDASLNGKLIVMTKDNTVGKFVIDQNLKVTTSLENSQENRTARYIIIEVNGYLGNADGAVINEIEIYDKNLNKLDYSILYNLEYDSSTDGYSASWTDSRYWNYTNLNDGQIAYSSNYPTGGQNCTVFLGGTKDGSSNAWARFIINLGENKEIGQIRVCIGGTDELSPCGSRTPKEVSIYSINDFIDGKDENSTYFKNIKQRNIEGLELIDRKQFSEIIKEPVWVEYMENDNSKYVNCRYLLFEVAGYFENEDAVVINEIEIYDKYNNKINYKILYTLAFDSSTNSYPVCWTNGNYWNYTNLNDGQIAYSSNYPTGGQNCTVFLGRK